MAQKIFPIISVIMPVYNGMPYLAESISSILNQTFADFEFIIINDGSTDNSSEIIDQFATRDQRIIFINDKTNSGLPARLNQALAIARGQFIARQDADDISLPTRFAQQFSFFQKNDDLFLCGSNALIIDEQGQELKSSTNLPCNPEIIKKLLPANNCFIHTSIMFRNWKICYRPKLKYTEDYDLYLRALTNNFKMANLAEPLVKSRYNPQSISYSKTTQQNLFFKKTKEFYWQRVRDGKDQYEQFDPQAIFAIANKNLHKATLKRKLEFLMQGNKFPEARRHLRHLLNTSQLSPWEALPFYLCLCLPPLYRLYRKIFCKIKYL